LEGGGAIMNREEWLNQVSELLVKQLLSHQDGATGYKYRVSVGFPKGSRGGKCGESIGQCWSPKASADKVHEIFISPKLDAFKAVEVLIHEHIHASAGIEAGHKGEFKRLALAVGLTGKMTSTSAGPELEAKVKAFLAKFEAYPHGVMKVDKNASRPGSRLVKCQCQTCGYTVRTTAKWLMIGAPLCPCNGDEMQIEEV
jgi:hypothetical protein